MALPEYAGQGAEADRGSQGEQEAGCEGSESESEADLEEDMDAALGDEALGSLAQACSTLLPIPPQPHQKSVSFFWSMLLRLGKTCNLVGSEWNPERI